MEEEEGRDPLSTGANSAETDNEDDDKLTNVHGDWNVVKQSYRSGGIGLGGIHVSCHQAGVGDRGDGTIGRRVGQGHVLNDGGMDSTLTIYPEELSRGNVSR